MNELAVDLNHDIEPVENDLLKRAVCLSIDFRRLGNSKKVDASQVQVKTDKRMLRISKILFEADEYEAILRHDRKYKHYLEKKCLPGPFKEGVSILLATYGWSEYHLHPFARDGKRIVWEPEKKPQQGETVTNEIFPAFNEGVH